MCSSSDLIKICGWFYLSEVKHYICIFVTFCHHYGKTQRKDGNELIHCPADYQGIISSSSIFISLWLKLFTAPHFHILLFPQTKSVFPLSYFLSHFLHPSLSLSPLICLSQAPSLSLSHGPFKSLFCSPCRPPTRSWSLLSGEVEGNCGLVVPPQYLIRIKHIRTILHSIIHTKLGDTRTVILHPSLTEEEGEGERNFSFNYP